ncbi:MAG: helix-turn-helix transcriptional regulator [Sphaerochaetaceae bacterium]|nr:helix-turn-helix transcriptional regulator [Sphaerochaetaceae bacterium]MDC7237714.1 helix-turn-helix transcriptional regulator [Sphaerochaetaceae bacterium]
MSERFDKERFSTDFKKYRLENNLTQANFAKRLGLNTHTIVSKIESGKIYPSEVIFNNFCKMARFNKNKYWKMDTDKTPFAFLRGNSKGVTTEDIEKLCRNIATQEYLLVLKKRYYEK